MSYPLMIVCGQKRVGKDTLVEKIQSIGIGQGIRVFSIAQAAILKNFCSEFYGIDRESMDTEEGKNSTFTFNETLASNQFERLEDILAKYMQELMIPVKVQGHYLLTGTFFQNTPKTVRGFLQETGSLFRAMDPNCFSNYAIGQCVQMINEGKADYTLISDGRYPNEIGQVKMASGNACLVTREGITNTDTHSSEKSLGSIPQWWFNYVIKNDHGLEDLQRKAEKLCERIFVP